MYWNVLHWVVKTDLVHDDVISMWNNTIGSRVLNTVECSVMKEIPSKSYAIILCKDTPNQKVNQNHLRIQLNRIFYHLKNNFVTSKCMLYMSFFNMCSVFALIFYVNKFWSTFNTKTTCKIFLKYLYTFFSPFFFFVKGAIVEILR